MRIRLHIAALARHARLSGGRDLWLRALTLLAIVGTVLWWNDTLGTESAKPGRAVLRSVQFDLRQDESIDLGWRDLGQIPGAQSAEASHIRFSRDGDAIDVSNIARAKRLDLRFAMPNGRRYQVFGETYPVPLGASGTLLLVGATLTLTYAQRPDGQLVVSVDAPDHPRFEATGPSFDTLVWTTPGLQPCPNANANWIEALRQRLAPIRRIIAAFRGSDLEQGRVIATLGGEKDCVSGSILQIGRLGPEKERLPWHSLRLWALSRGLLVGAYDAKHRAAVTAGFRPGGSQGPIVPVFSEQTWRIDRHEAAGRPNDPQTALEPNRLIVGSTTYDVLVDPVRDGLRHVTLRARERAPLFAAARVCGADRERDNLPHPLDTLSTDACERLFTERSSAGADAPPFRQTTAPDQPKNDTHLSWTWRLTGNPLENATAFAELQHTTAVVAVRVALLALALTLAVFCSSIPLLPWLMASALATGIGFLTARHLPTSDLNVYGSVYVFWLDLSLCLILLMTFGSAVWVSYRKGVLTALPLLMTAICCGLAFSGDAITLLDPKGVPYTGLGLFFVNWLIAATLLLLCEAGGTLGCLWLAVTVLCALGAISLATMALDGTTDKFIVNYFKHRLMFLDMLPPLAVAAATAPSGALARGLEQFASIDQLGVVARLRGGISAFWAVWYAVAHVAGPLRDLVRRARSGSPGTRGDTDRGRANGLAVQSERMATQWGIAKREAEGLGFACLRSGAGLVLLVSMIGWVATPSQTGLDQFQPAEFAKFAVILFCSRTLVQMFATVADDVRRRPVATIVLDMVVFVGLLVASVLALRAAFDVAKAQLGQEAADYTTVWRYGLLVAVLGVGATCLGLFRISLAALILVLFVGVMIVVPGVQSDWSPALIMFVIVLAMAICFFAMVGLQLFAASYRRQRDHDATPRPFKVTPRGIWGALAAWGFVVLFVAVVAVLAKPLWGVNALQPYRTIYVMASGLDAWDDSPAGRLDKLESIGLGQGRRVVVERLIAAEDLRFDRSKSNCMDIADRNRDKSGRTVEDPTKPPLHTPPCYIDSERQVLLSREALAAAPCGFAEEITPHEGGLTQIAGAMAWLSRVLVCAPERDGKAAADGEAAEPVDAGGKRLRPIDIPVVDSDFAGAFLVSRLGIGAAIAAFAAQLLLISAPVHGFASLLRIALEAGGPRRTTARLLLAMMSGCVALFSIQWMMSWSNILGLAPVMGQPMTLLSNASSHHVFMVIPALLTFMLGLRYAKLQPFVYRPRDPPRL